MIVFFSSSDKQRGIVAANLASLPLVDASCDIVVFCLSLMGTDWPKFLRCVMSLIISTRWSSFSLRLLNAPNKHCAFDLIFCFVASGPLPPSEACRVLRVGGILHVAEVNSRIANVNRICVSRVDSRATHSYCPSSHIA